MSKLLASLMRNYFPKRPSGAPLHTLSKLYDVPVGFVPPPSLFCGWILLFCGRRRVAVAQYRMICLVIEEEKSRSGSQGKVAVKDIWSRSISMQAIKSILINLTKNWNAEVNQNVDRQTVKQTDGRTGKQTDGQTELLCNPTKNETIKYFVEMNEAHLYVGIHGIRLAKQKTKRTHGRTSYVVSSFINVSYIIVNCAIFVILLWSYKIALNIFFQGDIWQLCPLIPDPDPTRKRKSPVHMRKSVIYVTITMKYKNMYNIFSHEYLDII